MYYITSKALFAGSASKVADQITDAVVDYVLHIDHNARINCRCLWEKNNLTIAGNIHAMTGQPIPYMNIAQQVLNFVDQKKGIIILE